MLNTGPLPATRGDCVDGPRPCPHVLCRHHLFAETERRGRQYSGSHPPIVVVERAESCSLDVAEANPDGMFRPAVAEHLGLTGERVRQIEERALLKIHAAMVAEQGIEDMRKQATGKNIAGGIEWIRDNMPEGTRLHAIHASTGKANSAYVTLVLMSDHSGKSRSENWTKHRRHVAR